VLRPLTSNAVPADAYGVHLDLTLPDSPGFGFVSSPNPSGFGVFGNIFGIGPGGSTGCCGTRRGRYVGVLRCGVDGPHCSQGLLPKNGSAQESPRHFPGLSETRRSFLRIGVAAGCFNSRRFLAGQLTGS
jgi:hypothetical protein